MSIETFDGYSIIINKYTAKGNPILYVQHSVIDSYGYEHIKTEFLLNYLPFDNYYCSDLFPSHLHTYLYLHPKSENFNFVFVFKHARGWIRAWLDEEKDQFIYYKYDGMFWSKSIITSNIKALKNTDPDNPVPLPPYSNHITTWAPIS